MMRKQQIKKESCWIKRAAHHAFDLPVDGCSQSAPFANDEERLACLFKLYEKMTKK
jgi:hypothetical protein